MLRRTNLRAENRLQRKPTAPLALSSSERRDPPHFARLTAAPAKPAEATPGFSSNRNVIDSSRVRRYSSGRKKRWFKFPIHLILQTAIGSHGSFTLLLDKIEHSEGFPEVLIHTCYRNTRVFTVRNQMTISHYRVDRLPSTIILDENFQ
jgi:hypothetical protein